MFAVVTPKRNCNWTLFYGIDYHSHWGTEFGGMAVLGHELVCKAYPITQSQFKTEFSPKLHLFSGPMGIGVISPKDEQPLTINPVNPGIGLFAIATVGYVENAEELVGEFMASGIGFEYDDEEAKTINMTKLVGMLISQSDNLVSGIEKMLYRIQGSISLMTLNTDGILAARSLYGHTPLFLAQKGNEWAVTLETTALPNLGFKVIKPLLPGEIIQLNENGPVTRSEEYLNKTQLCAFLPIYTAFPTAEFGDLTAEGYREKAGAYHAIRDYEEGIKGQMAAGMADSGTPYAIGYSQATFDLVARDIRAMTELALSGGSISNDQVRDVSLLLDLFVPYHRPLLKYTPAYGRSYTPPKQVDRDRIAKMKQLPARDIWDGLVRLILTEDSIVRATQLAQYLKQLHHIIVDLWGKSWPEIHARIGCPPLAWPCKYMLSTRNCNELAARRIVTNIMGQPPTDDQMRVYIDPANPEYHQMVSLIGEEIGVTSLRYLPLEETIRIIGQPQDQICTYCWNGQGV